MCMCVGGRGGKEQLTGPGSLPSSLPGTGARSQNGKNSSECASQETPPSRKPHPAGTAAQPLACCDQASCDSLLPSLFLYLPQIPQLFTPLQDNTSPS